MKKYRYVVSDKDGVHVKGMIRATNADDAKSALQKAGNVIISLGEDVPIARGFWNKAKLSFLDKMMFTKHLSIMIRVGITLTESLSILMSQLSKSSSRKMFENILNMVRSGQTLSASLSQYEDVFSEIYVNMVAIGEESGTLSEVLKYLDVQLEKEYELRKKVISAFIYPAVIIGITVLLMLGIVIFIMPKITDIFESFEVTLPLPTRVLIGMSDILVHKPHFVIIGGLVSAFLIFIILKSKFIQPFFHRIVLRLPVFGTLLKNVNLARFARTMHSLMAAGVPITRSLQITGGMFTNTLYRNAILESYAKVEQGGQLGESFKGNETLFPQLLTRMLVVGEKTGSLEETTEHLAMLYERNVDSITRNLTTLLEPFLLIFMAGMVGGVAISIILPIYQLPNLLAS